MLNVKREKRRGKLRQATILAAFARPLPNHVSRGVVHPLAKRSSGSFFKNRLGFRLEDREDIDGFHKILVLGVFFAR